MNDQYALWREEEDSREVIAVLGRLGRDVEVPSDFLTRVLPRADQGPAPYSPRQSWLGRLPWGVDVAVAALLILVFAGAVPQYLTWFRLYVWGVPPAEEEPIAPPQTRGQGGEAPLAILQGVPSAPPSKMTPLPQKPMQAECAQPESPPRARFTSEDELKGLLIGRWLSCNAPELRRILGSQDHVGIEFTPDRRWFTLRLDDFGRVVRGRGFDFEGTFEIIDTSLMNGPGAYQLNITRAGGGTNIVSLAVTDSPRKIRLTGMVGAEMYVPAPENSP